MKKMIATLAFTFLPFSCLPVPCLAADSANNGQLPVVASFSIIGDMVRSIGGDAVAVTTLVGADSDAHVFEPSAADAKAIAGAKIVFANGLGFEGWLEKLAASSGYEGQVVTVSRGVTPLAIQEEEHHETEGHDTEDHDTEGHGHHHEGTDPHAWQNVANARIYAANIAQSLAAALPEKADAINARATAYDQALAALDANIKTALRDIPQERRKVITSHDAFGYFGAAYNIRFLAPEGISTEAEPTAGDVAKLIRQIKNEGVKTVFVENMTSPKLITQIAKDTGATAGGTLYADALSKNDGPAATYIDMMRHNLSLIEKALKE